MAIPSKAELEDLDVGARLELIASIWDTIVEAPESLPTTADERAELDRRLADLEAHPETSIPWTEARERLRRGR
jgi:putative addiction module component (TIGR02574 family)